MMARVNKILYKIYIFGLMYNFGYPPPKICAVCTKCSRGGRLLQLLAPYQQHVEQIQPRMEKCKADHVQEQP